MPFPAPEHCLVATPLVDSDHPAVHAFAHRHGHGATPREQAVHLYYAVRDGVRYDPYRLDLSTAGMRASSVLSLGYGWCVTKAALLAAAARALGIPARLGFSDVRNHMSTQRMRDTMKTDIFVWHGYTELWLDGAWRKATPAFNVELCDRFGLLPLDFDGVTDSIYHPFDRSGQRHMEYLKERGSFVEMPLAEIVSEFRTVYPGWLQGAAVRIELHGSDFLGDVARESAA